MMRYALTGSQIFTGDQMLSDHALIVCEGTIESIVPAHTLPAAIEQVRLTGGILAPGFIDTQVNGGGGVLFNATPTAEAIAAIGATHRRFGTTGFLPTLISDRRDVMEAAISAARHAIAQNVPGMLGIHLEGPYLNVERKGVHPEQNIRLPEADALKLLASLTTEPTKTLVTLAPEQVPKGFVSTLVAAGVIVAAGHSAATYAQTQAGLEEGISGFTHLFNAMSPLTSREPGCVGAALEDKNSWCGLIVDLHHVHPATLKVALNAKPAGRMILVTDAIHTAGSDLHEFELFGNRLIRDNGKVTTPEGVLAGSDLTMIEAVANSVNALGLSLEESLRMASRYPAEFLGLGEQLGSLAPGYQADMVWFDHTYTVQDTWIKGLSTGSRHTE